MNLGLLFRRIIGHGKVPLDERGIVKEAEEALLIFNKVREKARKMGITIDITEPNISGHYKMIASKYVRY